MNENNLNSKKTKEEKIKEGIKKPKFQDILFQNLSKGNKVEVQAESDGSIKVVKQVVFGVERI